MGDDEVAELLATLKAKEDILTQIAILSQPDMHWEGEEALRALDAIHALASGS